LILVLTVSCWHGGSLAPVSIRRPKFLNCSSTRDVKI
jgi:hypothetical protein